VNMRILWKYLQKKYIM